MENFPISQYLRDFNSQNSRGICIACDKEVTWSRHRVAAHKRGSCPNVTVQESQLFQKKKISYNAQCSDDSSDDKKEGVGFQIGQYLCDFSRKSNRGVCISCGKGVAWARERVAAHKRANCANLAADEKKLFGAKFADDDASSDDDQSERRDVTKFQISAFLCDFNPETRRGVCIRCKKAVGWARERIAAHKRTNCKAVTAEEKKLFRKRRMAYEKVKPEDDSSDDEHSRERKVVPKGEIETIQISDYLRDYNSQTNLGVCLACDKDVGWARDKVASHKRRNCPNATEEEAEIFSKAGDSDEETETFQISDYLSNYNKKTNLGVCIACGKEIGWSRDKVASHKRRTCPNVTAKESKIFLKDEPENFQIGQFLCDLNSRTRLGKCISCGKEVGWAREKLASHKRRSCPNVTAEEKIIFLKGSDSDEEVEKTHISKYLRDLDSKTHMGVCIACGKEVGWARDKLASHKRRNCANLTVDESKTFGPEKTSKKAKFEEDSTDDEEPPSKAEAENFPISRFLCNFNKEANHGECIACGKAVVWARDRVAAHKRKNCVKASAEEKKFFQKRKTLYTRRLETGDIEHFEITDYLSRLKKFNKKGICKACGATVQWSRSRVESHKRSACSSGLKRKKNIFYDDDMVANDNRGPSDLENSRAAGSSKKKSKRSFTEVNIKERDDSSDECDYKIPEDPVSCFICSEGFGNRRPIQLTNILSSTQTPLYKVLESFTGIEHSVETANGSGVCQDCFINLEKYDSFQKKSRDIQNKVTAAYFKTRNEPVFIKEEPKFEIANAVVFTNLEPEYSFEPTDSFDGPEHSESPKANSDRWQSDDSEDEPLVSPKASLPASDRKRFQCYKCKKMSPTLHGTRIHMITEHSMRKKSFECSECSKVCLDKATIRSHYATHKKKEFLCIRCGKIFANEKYFKRHSMFHDDIRPFKCTVEGCEKSFRTPNNLRFHLRVHSGVKPFECPFCPGKRFATDWGRVLHLRGQHNQKEAKLVKDCKICGVAFENMSKLRTHLTNVHQVV